MKNRKYKVCRDNIYVGQVVKAKEIYRCTRKDTTCGLESGQLDASTYFPYRSMLFIPNDQKLSNDLLYRSPSYPILNITDDDTCLKLFTESPVIKKACNLSEILKYFGFDEELTYKDIMLIRKTFFTGRFAQENCSLFGYKEIMPGSFIGINEAELDRKYFDLLDYLGDHNLLEVLLGDEEKISAFTPHKKEGKIRKLSRF